MKEVSEFHANCPYERVNLCNKNSKDEINQKIKGSRPQSFKKLKAMKKSISEKSFNDSPSHSFTNRNKYIRDSIRVRKQKNNMTDYDQDNK